MEGLYQQVLAGAPGQLASDLFAAHILWFVSLLCVFGVVIFTILNRQAKGESEGTFVGALSSGVLLPIVFCIGCSYYSEALQIEKSPEHWAAGKTAKVLADALQ